MLRTVAFASAALLSAATFAAACGGSTADLSGASAPDAAPDDAGATKSDAAASDGASGSDATTVVTVDASTTSGLSHARCSTDAECKASGGGKCVELSPGGVRACSYPAPAPQACVDAGTTSMWPDQCCPGDGRCGAARCTVVQFCGGAFIAPHNECVTDECATNADCGAKGICLPIGVGDARRRTCLTGNECVKDADCTAKPKGSCVLPGSLGPASQCEPWDCNEPTLTHAYPLTCIYGNACADDAECPNGHCERTASGTTACVSGARTACPPPP